MVAETQQVVLLRFLTFLPSGVVGGGKVRTSDLKRDEGVKSSEEESDPCNWSWDVPFLPLCFGKSGRALELGSLAEPWKLPSSYPQEQTGHENPFTMATGLLQDRAASVLLHRLLKLGWASPLFSNMTFIKEPWELPGQTQSLLPCLFQKRKEKKKKSFQENSAKNILKRKLCWCRSASLVAQLVKNLPAMRETWVRSLSWEDHLEKGKAPHFSILAWRIPWTLRVHGVAKSQTWLSNFHRSVWHSEMILNNSSFKN